MNDSINEILKKILSDTDTANTLSNLLKSDTSEQKCRTQEDTSEISAQNPTVISLQKKEEMLLALKPVFGESFSKKADEVIKALQVAKIIVSISQSKNSQ